MNILLIPCETGQISDGYHTFDELYEHRCVLFLALMASNPKLAWIAASHSDGSMHEGWFVAGIHLPNGDITYHMPIALWPLAQDLKIEAMLKAPSFDGHTSSDVVARLKTWISLKQ